MKTKYKTRLYLPPANEVWGKVIFLHVCVILSTRGVCVVTRGSMHGWGTCVVGGGMHGCWGGRHAWLLGAWVVVGVCMVVGGMHGCWGACVVAGGMCGCGGACVAVWGAYMVVGAYVVAGGVHGSGGCAWLLGVCMVEGGHAWLLREGACVVAGGACMVAGGGVHRIQRDMVNERAVRILLECILVMY